MIKRYRDIIAALILALLMKQINGVHGIGHECPFAQLQEEYGIAPTAGLFVHSGNTVSKSNDYSIDSALKFVFAGYPKDDYLPLQGQLPRVRASRPTQPKNMQCAVPPTKCANDTKNYYFRTLDGSCNNLLHSGFGMALSRYARLLPPNYSDGVSSPTESLTGAPLPNARTLSLSLFGDKTKPDSFRTLLAVTWGQMVAHDISRIDLSGAPKDCCRQIDHPMCIPVPIHMNDPLSSGSQKACLNIGRTTSDADLNCPKRAGIHYTEKITTQTSFLDLSTIYGNSFEESQKLRLRQWGLLKTSVVNNQQYLPILSNKNGKCGDGNNQCFDVTDFRNHFIPNIIVLNTIMVREHNRIASTLAKLSPQLSDEDLFQQARKINIAQFQKITYYDWLPLMVGNSYAYDVHLIYNVQPQDYVSDYDATQNSAPYAEYSIALRYLHNTIPGWFSLVTSDRYFNQTLRLSNYFGKADIVNLLLHNDNFDSLIRGQATQLQKLSDGNIDKEIQYYFGRKRIEQFGKDLKTIDIQRGRDFGLASYNEARSFCGLQRAYDWSGFANEISADNIAILQKLYKTPEDVDLVIGGALEPHVPDSLFGPTFQCIIARQFHRTRVGDRFFFENENANSGFSREQLAEIRKTSLASLLCRNADYLQTIQTNAFVFPNPRNELRNCHTIPQLDLSKWITM